MNPKEIYEISFHPDFLMMVAISSSSIIVGHFLIYASQVKILLLNLFLHLKCVAYVTTILKIGSFSNNNKCSS